MLKTDNVASTEIHGKYITYVSFNWPPVVAVQALHSSGSYKFLVSTCELFARVQLIKKN